MSAKVPHRIDPSEVETPEPSRLTALGALTAVVTGDMTWEEATTRRVNAVPLSQLDMTPPAPLLLDRLDPSEPTILFGTGAIGKGALACSWIVQLVKQGKRVLILDYEDHGGEWARRINGLGGPETADKVLWVAPLREGMGPLAEAVPMLSVYVKANAIDYVVIDSAVIACGVADAMKPEAAVAYFTALQGLGVPSLTLAHVTKADDPRYPFGSVFWHNLARVTWSMERKGEDILLTCRKASNYMKPSAATVELVWYEGKLRDVTERRATETLLDRICEVLADGAVAVTAIAAAMNDGRPAAEHTSPDTIRRTLNRELKDGPTSRVTTSGGQWSLRPDSENERDTTAPYKGARVPVGQQDNIGTETGQVSRSAGTGLGQVSGHSGRVRKRDTP